MAEVELLDEIVEWLATLSEQEHDRVVVLVDRLADLGSAVALAQLRRSWQGLLELRFTLGPTSRRMTYRFTKDGRIVLLTTFRKQRNNERAEIERARKQAVADAASNP